MKTIKGSNNSFSVDNNDEVVCPTNNIFRDTVTVEIKEGLAHETFEKNPKGNGGSILSVYLNEIKKIHF